MNRKFVGVKGIACLIVLFSHITCAFWPGLIFSDSTITHLDGMDLVVARSFLSPVFFLWNGSGAVTVFIILSCYFVIKSLNDNDCFFDKASQITAKRYLRLALPFFLSGLLVFIIQRVGLFCHLGLSDITGYSWLDNYYQNKISFPYLLYSSFILVPALGDSTINTVLWMMPYVFWGTFISIIFALLIKKYHKRSLLIIIIFGILLVRVSPRYSSCSIAAILYLFESSNVFSKKKNKVHYMMGIVSLVISFMLFNINEYYEPKSMITVGTWKKIVVLIYGGATLLLLLGLDCLQPKNSKLLAFLDKISFSVCLVQMPIICSFSCFVFISLYNYIWAYWLLFLVVESLSICLVLVCSFLFNRFIEQPCLNISNHVTQWIMGGK